MLSREEYNRRIVIFVTFCITAAAIGLISTSLATHYWIQSDIVKTNAIGSQPAAPFFSGLFYGRRELPEDLGPRMKEFYVQHEVEKSISFFSKGFWIAIILFCTLSLFWALLGAIFSLINTVVKPIETINGPIGLYVWNAAALICAFITIILFVIEFYISIDLSVLTPDMQKQGFSSKDSTWFGYSFWLLVGALFAFCINIVLLLVSGMELRAHRYHSSKPKEIPIPDGGVLIY